MRAPRAFISPMGEPFRPAAGGASGLAMWFAQADRNGDGALTAGELKQDADRFFRALDVKGDGEIDPQDVNRYENVIAPEIRLGGGYGGSGGRHGRHGGGKRGGRGGPGGGSGGEDGADNGLEGAGRFGLLNIPEPVMDADADLNRGVSLAEFESAAGKRFLMLDTNHDGRLTLAELQALQQAAMASPGRRHRQRPPGGDSDDGWGSPIGSPD
ncbi:MAG: EF-hand domain-containing protein [Sphingomonadales bacterium]